MLNESERLVEVTRSGVVEMVHYGSIVVARSNAVIAYAGDPNKATPLRSTAKPFQLSPFVSLGGHKEFSLSDEEIALLVSSHNGEPKQTKLLRFLLSKANLSECDLHCGVHMPYTLELVRQIYRTEGDISQIHNNCSGKHIGMLLLCKLLGHPIQEYWTTAHPVQQMIVRELCNILQLTESSARILVDGCGVPTLQADLARLASAYSLLAYSTRNMHGSPLGTIGKAMLNAPFMVGGTERMESSLMELVEVIAKPGADGLFCMGVVKSGLGIAIKVDSGNEFASEVCALEVLRQLALLTPTDIVALARFLNRPVKSHTTQVIGTFRPVFQLRWLNDQEVPVNSD